jgi:hypothetical protein
MVVPPLSSTTFFFIPDTRKNIADTDGWLPELIIAISEARFATMDRSF